MIDIGIALILMLIGYLIGREPNKQQWLNNDTIVEQFGDKYILKDKRNEKIR